LGNEPEVSSLKESQTKITTFSKTKPLASYLFAVIAGPYREIKGQSTYNGIPMRIFSRESNFKYMEKL
jgi:aminopeptidase N